MLVFSLLWLGTEAGDNGLVGVGYRWENTTLYHKNTDQITTKTPIEMPQKHRLGFVV